MSPEDQLDLVKRHYALNGAGDFDGAAELVTDDFVITIPPYMPFAGVYTGKTAMRTLIPIVVASVSVSDVKYVATTVGDGYVAELVEFSLAGNDGPPMQGVEVNSFRDGKICEIRPYYFDATSMIEAAKVKERFQDGPRGQTV
ncbi:MAG TPA: nuclear transport factor 2 family protein [Galbitalea sp.]